MINTFGENANSKWVQMNFDNLTIIKSDIDEPISQEDSLEFLGEIINWIDVYLSKYPDNKSKLPNNIIQLYSVYHYIYNVKLSENCGHHKFIQFCGKKSNLIWPYVLSGLYAMGAFKHGSIFRNMVICSTKNIDNIANHKKELSSLDMQFQDVEKDTPILITAANWVKSWSDLSLYNDKICEFNSDLSNNIAS